MATRLQRENNLAVLIRAIAEAYHRNAGGRPVIQQIGFKTGIKTATVHLWAHSGVDNPGPVQLRTLSDAYHLDFPKVLNYVFGPPGQVEGDALLASLRRGGDDGNGHGARAKRRPPIRGGSDGPATLSVGQVARKIIAYRTWLWNLAPRLLPLTLIPA